MKTSINKTVAVGFGLAFALLAGVGILEYRSATRLVDASHWVVHTDEVLLQLHTLISGIKDAESSVRGYVATNDQRFLAAYQGADADSAKRLQGLRVLTSDNATQQRRLDTLVPLIRRRFDHLAEVLGSFKEGGSQAAREFMAKGEGLVLTERISALASEMENEERRLLIQRNAAAEASTRRTNAVIFAGSVLAIGLLLGAALIIFRDIGERKRIDEELRQAVAYNRSLIEASLDPLVTISPDGKITDVNSTAILVTGHSREELIGANFSNYFTDPERAAAGYQKVFREGQVQDYALEIRHRDGHITPVLYNASVYRDKDDKIVGVFAAARDITERKRAEEEIRRLATFPHFNPTLILEFGRNEEVLFVNPATQLACERLGISDPREYIPSSWRQKLSQSDPIEGKLDFQEIPIAGRIFGEQISYLPQFQSLRIYALDITERKQFENQILRLNTELEERVAARTAELTATNKELESFTYAVAHDLRAPLRHIQGFSGLLLAEVGSQLNETACRYLERIQEGVNRMARLIEDLLNLSRMGRQELRLGTCGLNSIVEEVLSELQPEIKDRQIEWRIGRLPFVECDAGLVKHVLTNLLSNAVKFTGGREKAVIVVDRMTVDGQTAVYVRDNGVGFSMKYADRLFGIFQRLHRQEDFEGTGVGLATVQRIIHKHGGRVWAEAKLEEGATFYFTLGTSRES